MIARAVEVFEEGNFQRSETVVFERYRVFDNERDFASLHLADDLEVWAKFIHGSTSIPGSRSLKNQRLVSDRHKITCFQLSRRRKDYPITCAQARNGLYLIAVD